jgi:uncharacterized protein (TIGR02118 family)
MAEVKLTMMYPTPADVEAFEKAYVEEHLPLLAREMSGHTKFVATRVLAAVREEHPPFHRIAEFYYPSGSELEQALTSEGAQQTVAHAASISTGGPPVILVGEEELLPSY